jgi:hypothetical protein
MLLMILLFPEFPCTLLLNPEVLPLMVMHGILRFMFHRRRIILMCLTEQKLCILLRKGLLKQNEGRALKSKFHGEYLNLLRHHIMTGTG